jgi:hypothetical protein
MRGELGGQDGAGRIAVAEIRLVEPAMPMPAISRADFDVGG